MRKRKIQKFFSFLLTLAILLGVWWNPSLNEMTVLAEEGTVVWTREEFMDALEKRQSPILVYGQIIVGQQADTNGRMLPVTIPGGTVIQGMKGSFLCSRSPIQLEGDGVTIQNIELTFESTDALGSIPHREIFLAGHSLTLDNVNTYLEGGADIAMGGTEEELLPTVYAGGYPGTKIGNNASLTVQNSNDETMFKGIFMGHGSENGTYEPYEGTARLRLDKKAIVREAIDARENVSAEIVIEESGSAKAKQFLGNNDTTLRVRQSTISDAVIEDVGTVVLDQGACLEMKTNILNHVTVKNNACLDFSSVQNAFIMGDFCGRISDAQTPAEENGMIVLDSEGSLTICGTVAGVTQFQTGNRLFPGILLSGRKYIVANRQNQNEINFVLSEKDIENGFSLEYQDNAWIPYRDTSGEELFEIGSISATPSAAAVDLFKIMEKTDETSFCNIIWRDAAGNVMKDEMIEAELPYEMGYMFVIQTDYWKSSDPQILKKTDWSNSVGLEKSAENFSDYYFYAWDGVKSGKYTFLFCSKLVEEDLETVSDVQALKDFVKAEFEIYFYDSEKGETPPELPPVHKHQYESRITKEPTCTEEGTETYECLECGDTYTKKIAAKDHTIVTDPAEEADCTKTGKTAGSHCSVCSKVIVAQQIIPKSDHTIVTDPAEEADCTKTGKTAGSHCSVCSKVIVAQQIIPKSDHTIVTDPAEEADCTKTGKTAGSHCSVCSEVIEAQQEVPRKDHNYQTQIIKATVNADGRTSSVCTICGAVSKNSIIYRPKTLELALDSYVYSGKELTPAVTVKDSSGKIIDKSCYTAEYHNNSKVGIAEVTVHFGNIYDGTLSKTFTIIPRPSAIVKLTAKPKGFQVKWKKQKKEISGYMIQYSTKKKFTKKSVRTVFVNKKKMVSKSILKLKSKKKYFVRICTYKSVKRNGKTENIYSKWSKVKPVKTK